MALSSKIVLGFPLPFAHALLSHQATMVHERPPFRRSSKALFFIIFVSVLAVALSNKRIYPAIKSRVQQTLQISRSDAPGNLSHPMNIHWVREIYAILNTFSEGHKISSQPSLDCVVTRLSFPRNSCHFPAQGSVAVRKVNSAQVAS